ncbi:MAG TPA: hypothetical protein VFM18_16275 [Methanosarcina sp.]|nr:hypothetical protein [Methanosarcina sp.]
MTDEINNAPESANNATPAEPTAPKYTEVEQKAMEMGWVPKEEYTGDPERWKSAEVFLALDEPIKRIESQSKELKAVRKALEALQEHHSKVREAEYKRAMDDLKAARRQAYQDGDIDKVEALEERIDEFKAQAEEIKQAAKIQVDPEPTVHPEFQHWLNRNPWYQSYKHMAAFADEVGLKLNAQGLPRAEILKRVEEEVRKEFPNKFRNPNKDTAPSVEGNAAKRNGAGAKADGEFELSEQERTIMNTLVRNKVITKEKYIAELRKVKGLE